MTIAILIILLLFNAVFAMGEMALVSSRRILLEQAGARGDRKALSALGLLDKPTQFLSTVQLVATVTAVLMGAFCESVFEEDLRGLLMDAGVSEPAAAGVASPLVIVAATYITVVLGELVPKRLGLHAPEPIASFLALPMRLIATAALPVIWLLSASTNLITRPFGIHPHAPQVEVSEAEVKGLLEKGAQSGVFEQSERILVERVLGLGDQRITAIMVPRADIDHLDADSDTFQVRVAVATSPHSHFPLCEQGTGLDGLIGVLHIKDLVKNGLLNEAPDLRAIAAPPVYVPESATVLKVLDAFRESGQHIAFVLDEHGSIEGLVTLNDVVEAIIGQVSTSEAGFNPEATRRDDGSYLMDGSLPISRLKELLSLQHLPREDQGYQTMAGLLLANLGHIPVVGEKFQWVDESGRAIQVEVADMDHQRVDKVLVQVQISDDGQQNPSGESLSID